MSIKNTGKKREIENRETKHQMADTNFKHIKNIKYEWTKNPFKKQRLPGSILKYAKYALHRFKVK